MNTQQQIETVHAATATATAYGDGRNGPVTSDDDVLDLDLAVPGEVGGPGGDLTNPDHMFAARSWPPVRAGQGTRRTGSPALPLLQRDAREHPGDR